MYTNPRRINRNAKLGQLEAMHYYVSEARKEIAEGAADSAGDYVKRAWHAMKLAGTEAVKASRKRNY